MEKTKTTSWLATLAFLSAALIETTKKYLTGRQRPSYYYPVTHQNNNIFPGPFYQFTKDKTELRVLLVRQVPTVASRPFCNGNEDTKWSAHTCLLSFFADRTEQDYAECALGSDVLSGRALGFMRETGSNLSPVRELQKCKKYAQFQHKLYGW